MVIDLHLAQNNIEHPIVAQLNYLKRELDRALVLGLNEVIVIHGIGTGALKAAVHKIAKDHPLVDSYEHGYNHLYGFGSTKIIFK